MSSFLNCLFSVQSSHLLTEEKTSLPEAYVVRVRVSMLRDFGE